MSKKTRTQLKAARRKAKAENKPKYVVRLNSEGYYGPQVWTAGPKETAYQFSLFEANAARNRMSSYNLGYSEATVEPV